MLLFPPKSATILGASAYYLTTNVAQVFGKTLFAILATIDRLLV
jgi:hypothetical protein